jgi:hypothetical protein
MALVQASRETAHENIDKRSNASETQCNSVFLHVSSSSTLPGTQKAFHFPIPTNVMNYNDTLKSSNISTLIEEIHHKVERDNHGLEGLHVLAPISNFSMRM